MMRRVVAGLCLLSGIVLAGEGTWCGFYGGMHVGMAKDHDPDWTYPNGAMSTLDDVKDDTYVGAQLGYNWQYRRLVLGLEADFSFAEIHGSGICPNPSYTCDAEVREVASLRGRLGCAIGDWLPYLTAGYTMAETEVYVDSTAFGVESDEGDLTGWVYGGGVAYAVTDHFSVFVEALYYDFGRERVFNQAGYVADVKFQPTAFRFGINYHFW